MKIPSNPAVKSLEKRSCLGWESVYKRNVGDKPGAEKTPFEDVVAEHRFTRETVVEQIVKHLDVDEPFPRKNSFPVKILIEIRYWDFIGGDTSEAAHHPGERGGEG